MGEGILSGIKIIDITRVLAGPYCTMILSDLGADVIKIEKPGSGDESRYYAPMNSYESGYFLSVNRNKKSVCLDLKNSKDREKLYRLVQDSDVLIHNYPAKTAEELGLGYNNIKSINDSIVYLSITGYGNTGPKSNLPGYDLIIQAISGINSITGTDNEHITRIPNSTTDLYGGFMSAILILASLLNREKRGKKSSRNIDLSLFETALYTLPHIFAGYSFTGQNPQPAGFINAYIAPYSKFDTADLPIVIACANDSQWKKLCNVLNIENAQNDPRFATTSNRVRNVENLTEIIEEKLKTNASVYWIEKMTSAGIPAGRINRISDVLQDEQVKARNSILKRTVRGMNMYFPSFPAFVDGIRPEFYRDDAPELCTKSKS